MSLLLISVLAVAASCPAPSYVFGECGEARTRSAYFYWKEPCNETLPPAVDGLDCDWDCPPGTFLDLDLVQRRSTCTQCPPHTYNIGGGEVVSGSQGDWTLKRSRFSTYCWTTHWLEWAEGKDCSAWTVAPGGRWIAAGESPRTEVWVSSSLVYYSNLLTPGSLTLRYAKVTRTLLGFRNGALSVLVNAKAALRDDSLNRNSWQTVVVPLQQGPNEVTVEFEKYCAAGHEDVSAKIDLFEVRGTARSSHFCYPCEDGISEAGSDHCSKCPADHYLARNATVSDCVPCPPTHYSEPGSTQLHDCKPRTLCTLSDYHAVFGPCVSDKQTRYYVWNEPVRCQGGVALPPEERDAPCYLCSPGEYHARTESGETQCQPCPEGSALTETHIRHSCVECVAGTYAPRVWNISRWSDVPSYFTNECIARDRDVCSSGHGWLPAVTFLSTGAQVDYSFEVTLSRTVNITDSESFLSFAVSLSAARPERSRLTLEVDGQEYQAFTAPQELTVSSSVRLDVGVKVLKWVYRREGGDVSDSARIHWISVRGLSEGGSPACEVCPAGRFSVSESSSCEECAAGSTHSPTHQSCVLCPGLTFSSSAAHGCSECPAFTRPTKDHTQCVAEDVISHQHKNYAIRNLTGVAEDGEDRRHWICKSSDRMKLFCSGTFYGPILERQNNYYLSVLNPGGLPMHKYPRADDSKTAYAWGVLDASELHHMPRFSDDSCIVDRSKAVVNLGSRVEEVTASSSGFTVLYRDGSLCSQNASMRFAAAIEFLCSKEEGDGWPVLASRSECSLHFTWRTRFACNVCPSSQLQREEGQCSDGQRTVRMRESPDCVSPLSAWEEPCSVVWDLLASWPGLIGAALLLSLCVAGVVLFVCRCRVKRQYTLLVERDPPAIELT